MSLLSPSLLSNVGVVIMEDSDVGWRLMLAQWIERRPQGDRDLVKSLCDIYIEKLMSHLEDCTKPPLKGGNQVGGKGPFYRRQIYQTQQNMLSTFTSLFECLINPYEDSLVNAFPDLNDREYERYFNFACVWAFAGTLEAQYREPFSSWWKSEFEKYIDYPKEGTVFDYLVDSESHQFVRWTDNLPAYSGSPHIGLPSDSFVHTVSSEQIYYLLGLLSDYGKPVMLVGENGCGKTAIVNERIRTVCSGEVAEVLALTVSTNRFTNARLIYQRLGDRLEWKHGRTYVPRGNKRLMCLVDDLNLAQVDKFGCQTAIELVRQHIDDGGFYDPDSHAWRYVKNVTYVTTVNPAPVSTMPGMSPRVLRHFAILGVPYPSSQELQSVYTTLLHTHFITPEVSSTVTLSSSAAHHLGIHDEKVRNVIREEEEALRHLVATIVKVTLELQDRLRSMFLPTAQRCHYIFTLKDLGNIFRNLCLSLRPACNKDTLLLLWQHECQWVYGHRMVNEVDYDRFQQAFITAVRKDFTNEDQISLMSGSERPIFSNLIEQDSGVVLSGNALNRNRNSVSEEDAETDTFKPVYKVQRVRELMERGMEEYNKTHPPIKLALYRAVLEQVCRLARVIASPHEVAHTVLVAEGCAGRCSIIAQLSAHLCGYTVVKINPISPTATKVQHMEHFQADLVAAYTRAGVKADKLLLLVREEDLAEEDLLVFLTEFIVSGSISHLFSYEEATTIINSIRTEVTQAGLTYTRDVAWDFFLKTVRKNFRVCLIANDSGSSLQRRCREFPAFTKNVNFLWFPHWSKKLLVKHAIYHLKEVSWMERVQRENIAHMLANMHVVMRQQDGQEMTTGQYQHITNTTYEKFVERFISLARSRYDEIQEYHAAASAALDHIQRENSLATKLRKQLEHERVVLQERKAGTIKVLSQIGQDTAITEQQVKIVRVQMEKITRLKKLLPEYQVAHERAVYKAIAIVADTKKIVQSIDNGSLQELRAMSKPIIDIEDLMAAIIMILKSPSADLTWQKGAKRLMANLERFSEELLTFDDQQLPEATLNLVEPYLKKASFDPETLERKTGNTACASLCRWVRGVVRYHRMMVSKVKPLHNKVEQTTQAVDNAEHKMMTLENKRKALEVRLADLARGFEEATIDKNNQEEKTINMDKTLETVGRLKKILKGEYLRCQQIYDSLPFRLSAIAGGVAMASALVTYLGPYHYNVRRLMLTVHFPNCLRERGIPLLIDSINELKGRVVDWSIDGLKTASGASGQVEDYESLMNGGSQLGDIPEVDEDTENEQDIKDPEEEKKDEGSEKKDLEKAESEDQPVTNDDDEEEEDKAQKEDESGKDEDAGETQQEEPQHQDEDAEEEDEEDEEEDYYRDVDYSDQASQEGSEVTSSSMPVITTTQYTQYIRSLVKLLVGQQQLLDWVQKDFGLRQLENAAILLSSWQRPPLLIDPYGEGVLYLRKLNSILHKKQIVALNMDTRTDPSLMLSIEKCILKGKGLLLNNCEQQMDGMIAPLVNHRNSVPENAADKEPRLVTFLERRILCHSEFRLYLHTAQPKPRLSPEIASQVTLINYGLSNETLVDDLLNRAFARLRPQLFSERCKALSSINQTKTGLLHISDFAKKQMFKAGKVTEVNSASVAHVFPEKDVEVISEVTKKRVQMAQKIRSTEGTLLELESLRDELFPLARRATLLYAIVRSLACVQREYQFTLEYFLRIFDDAVGGAFPPEFLEDPEKDVIYKEDTTVESHYGNKSDVDESMATDSKKAKSDNYEDDFEDENKPSTPKPVTASEANVADAANVQPEDKEGMNEDEEKIPIIDLPEAPELPTDGVEYSKMPADEIRQLIDVITGAVYQQISRALYDEHKLLFATMLCLNIQAEAVNADNDQNIMDEELSLLLQGNPGLGMQLSLADFECDAEQPSWLPQEKWDDIVAISVLPGPLDSLCVQVALASDQWKAWYRADDPENVPIPLQNDSEETENGESELPDFHRLILIRMLRPDRLPTAMAQYVAANLPLDVTEHKDMDTKTLIDAVREHWGALVLLPLGPSDQSEGHSVSSIRMHRQPADVIVDMAKAVGVEVERLVIGAGSEDRVTRALDMAEKEEAWLILDGVHLASSQLSRSLRVALTRVAYSREKSEANANSKFCVWITTQPSDSLPVELLQNMFTITWEALQSIEGATASTQAPSDGHKLKLSCGSLQDVFSSAIVSSLKSVSSSAWSRLEKSPLTTQRAVYGVVVIQAALIARQAFGTRGLSQWYPLTSSQIEQAIDILTLPSVENDQETVCRTISKVVLGNILCTEQDQTYANVLASQVLNEVINQSVEVIHMGNVEIPLPPSNTSPGFYSQWFESQIGADAGPTTEALCLLDNVDREKNEAESAQFLHYLEHLYESQNMDPGDILVRVEPSVDLYRLRSILDTVWEQLPALLELGVVPQRRTDGQYDFPYHRPSVVSIATVESVLMPESLGFVLLQECQWLNALLCHIRQNIYDLQQCILGGVEAISTELQQTMFSLLDEHVPSTWVHPNCQPSTHTLMSWQSDLRRRHQQMQGWVKHGMVPTFSDKTQKLVAPSSHGTLRSVWLGGLVNPQALFTALRQEKAVISDCLIDQVGLACDISDYQDDVNKFDAPDEGGLLLNNLYLQGARWDVENNCLNHPRNNLDSLPMMYIRPVLNRDTATNHEDEEAGKEKPHNQRYQCPVFMNKARQVCVETLPLNCAPDSAEHWILTGTAIILDPGVPEDSPRKSRSFVAAKPVVPVSARLSETASSTQHASGLALNLPEDMAPPSASETGRSEVKSAHSQLSYKQMTPRGPALPPDLTMKREDALMYREQPPSHHQSQESLGKESQRSRTSQGQESQRSRTSNGSKPITQPESHRTKTTSSSQASKPTTQGPVSGVNGASKDSLSKSDTRRSRSTRDSQQSIEEKGSQRSQVSKTSKASKSSVLTESQATKTSKSQRQPESQRSKTSKDSVDQDSQRSKTSKYSQDPGSQRSKKSKDSQDLESQISKNSQAYRKSKVQEQPDSYRSRTSKGDQSVDSQRSKAISESKATKPSDTHRSNDSEVSKRSTAEEVHEETNQSSAKHSRASSAESSTRSVSKGVTSSKNGAEESTTVSPETGPTPRTRVSEENTSVSRATEMLSKSADRDQNDESVSGRSETTGRGDKSAMTEPRQQTESLNEGAEHKSSYNTEQSNTSDAASRHTGEKTISDRGKTATDSPEQTRTGTVDHSSQRSPEQSSSRDRPSSRQSRTSTGSAGGNSSHPQVSRRDSTGSRKRSQPEY